MMPKGYTFDSNHGPGVGISSSGSSSSGSGGSSYSSGSSGSGSSITSKLIGAAQNIQNVVSTNGSLLGQKVRESLERPVTSALGANMYDSYLTNYGAAFDMDEYYDKLMDMAQYNNDWSAAQAEKQMQYQTRSDQAAMAWSAKEAALSREWTKNLSDTAHQREVKDLLAAGINPILSANNGAWSGSGAVGQSSSSSGAMGQTDMSASGAFSSLVSGMMTTARDLAVTRLNIDSQKYVADKQFAAAKMAAETSIFNNNNNIDANKAIRQLDRDADIMKAGISADATRYAAAASAGAMTSAAATNAAAARYSADQHLAATKETARATRYSASKHYLGTKETADTQERIAKINAQIQQNRTDSNMFTNPAGYLDYMQKTDFGQYLNEVVDAYKNLNSYNGYTPEIFR